MCPQPPSWQAVALGLLILNSPQPHLLPSPRSTASWEGRTRKVQVAPGSARLSRPAGRRGLRSRGRAPRSLARSPSRGRCRSPQSRARGRSSSGQRPFLPGEPAEGGPALLPVPPTAARARRPLGAGSRARSGRLSAAPTPASSKGRAAPGPARPSDWKGERAAREPGARTRPDTARLRGPSTAGERGRGARGSRGAGRAQRTALRGSWPWKPSCRWLRDPDRARAQPARPLLNFPRPGGRVTNATAPRSPATRVSS